MDMYTCDDVQSLKTVFHRRPLIRLLRLLEQSDDKRVKTRDLLDALHLQNYAYELIAIGEREGFLTHERVKPEGKGNWPVYYGLTKKGRRVLALAEEFNG